MPIPWIDGILPKVKVVADALSKKEKLKPSRVRALGMIVKTSLKARILKAQSETLKEENLEAEKLYNVDQKFEFWLDGRALGTQLDMSTAYHPQTDESESTIQIMEDMLRACVIDFKGSWDTHLPLLTRLDIIQETVNKITTTKERLRIARSRQKSYADNRRKSLEFQILENVDTTAYKLELPQELNGIHDVFHVSNLKKCLTDKMLVVLLEEIHITDKLLFK
ncbi:putative reverse transcriptase domain-containing protein [Tanacetum coccineum]|uniref:Reverse transcriptase domain-containing protein n=1 Tax=Tanacetum coccineum TaxID=301880 RepID=A0ABQ5G9N6_9ASTR